MAKKDKTTRTDVEVAQDAAVPAYIKQDSQRGAENTGIDDVEIPRLMLVQALSSCKKKNEPDYIEDCEEGDLYNNVTRKVYGAEIYAIPVMFQKEYIVWKDMKQGGGFGGAFPTDAEAQQALTEQERPDDWESVPTSQFYCLLITNPNTVNETIEQMVVSMAKSKNKVARRWNSLIRMNGGDSFSRLYKIEGVGDKNQQGQDFQNLKVSAKGFVSEKAYMEAEKLYEQIKAGAVTINRDEESASTAPEETEGDEPF